MAIVRTPHTFEQVHSSGVCDSIMDGILPQQTISFNLQSQVCRRLSQAVLQQTSAFPWLPRRQPVIATDTPTAS
jgi:hypothetical protein